MNAIQKATATKAVAKTEQVTMQTYVKKMEGEIKKALPSVITPERFTRMVLSALSTNPKLGSCTPNSFLGAMMQAAQLGVEPNTILQQAWLVPYSNKGIMEAQFELGYKGLIDLAYRSGQVASIQAQTVYENDYFDYSFGLEPTLKHIPADVERGELKAVYAVIKLKDGGYAFDVMSVEDIRRHAKQYSKAYSSGFSPWATSFEEMAKKTVLKRVLKFAPLRSEVARAVAADGTVKSELSADMTDVADETVYEMPPEDYDVTDDGVGAEDVEA